AQAMDAPPVCDPVFMRCLAECFLSPDDAFSLSLCWQGQRLMAAVPTLRRGKLPKTRVSFDNSHMPYWLFPLDLREVGIADEVVAHLMKGADHLVFRRMHPKAAYTQALVRAAQRLDYPAVLASSWLADAFVRLRTPWED